ncbi:hypothetical protein FDP41_007672 [Naegleria fowleri]|uniref:Uncharacterized protein n=1 Tax=Naegleria fowleri TaxID=5763 RepID=A0A6A5C320_NAEFO|nr:uncharacterized protein FDP41_007672 [Naegleria fowleri]KAF0983757.1 hypothetical protein FDP41_007672 [Naegleria fowleri]CAG4708928.1 unnamed protein product [Naegleria fowleri]
MGQQNKRSSLSLDEKALNLFNVGIDTSSKLQEKRIQSTPTPTDYQQEGRRRSKSSLPAITLTKTQEKQPQLKGYMKGRRPRKDSPEGEADQANMDDTGSNNNNSTTTTTTTIQQQQPKKRSTVHKLFKKNKPSSTPSPSLPSALDELPKNKQQQREYVMGSYIHPPQNGALRRGGAQASKKPTPQSVLEYNSERLRSKSAPVIYSTDKIQVVGGHLQRRDAINDPLPDVYITITPPLPEENTLTKNKYQSPYIVVIPDDDEASSPSSTSSSSTTSSKSLDEEPYLIVLDEYITYVERPLTKKVGPIMKKKKEKLREMVQLYYLQREELVAKTRRDLMPRSGRRR